MRKLICLLLSCNLLTAQVALVAHGGGQGTVANSYVAPTGSLNAATANRGLACVSAYGGDPTTATVTGTSGAWSYVSGTLYNSTGGATTNTAIFTRSGTFSASENLTATLVSKFPVIAASYYSNLGAVDQINGSTYTSGTTFQAGSITPTLNSELAFSCYGITATTNVSGLTVSGSGATLLDSINPTGANGQALGAAYAIQTTAAAFNPTWNNSGVLGVGAGAGVNISSFLFVAPATSNMPPIVMGARRVDPSRLLFDSVKRIYNHQGI